AVREGTRQGGLRGDGVTSGEGFRVTTRPAEPTDQVIGAFTGGIFDITTAAQSGLYRSEFLTQGFAESSFHAAAFTNPLIGFRDPVPRRSISLGAALRAEGSARAYDKPPRQLYEVRRADGSHEAYTVLGLNAGVEGD